MPTLPVYYSHFTLGNPKKSFSTVLFIHTSDYLRYLRKTNKRTLLFKFWTLCALSHPLGRLGTIYDVHLGLIGKRVADFLLVLVELFSLGVTAEALWGNRSKIAISLQHGQHPEFQVESPPIIFARLVRPMNALQLCC